jgi:transposase
MLQFAPGVKVYLDGLAADVAQTLRADPYSGAAFVFRSKRGDYVKILTWDGSCRLARWLDARCRDSAANSLSRAAWARLICAMRRSFSAALSISSGLISRTGMRRPLGPVGYLR